MVKAIVPANYRVKLKERKEVLSFNFTENRKNITVIPILLKALRTC